MFQLSVSVWCCLFLVPKCSIHLTMVWLGKIQIEGNNWIRKFKGKCWKAPDGIIGVPSPQTFTGTNAWHFTYIELEHDYFLEEIPSKKLWASGFSPAGFPISFWSRPCSFLGFCTFSVCPFANSGGVYEDSTSARMGWCWTPEIQVVWVSQDGRIHFGGKWIAWPWVK